MTDSTPRLTPTKHLMEVVHDPALRHLLNEILGDFCHQCRNRLNSLKLCLYLARRQLKPDHCPAWLSLENDYRRIEDQLERIQTLCHPGALAPVVMALDLLFDDRRKSWSQTLVAVGCHLEFVQSTGGTLVSFDVQRMGAALDAVVQWRAEQGRSTRTILRWWVDAQEAHVEWVEEPNLSPLQPLRHENQTFCWSIPILTRVVMDHGGTMRVDDRQGWSMRFSWPSQVGKV